MEERVLEKIKRVLREHIEELKEEYGVKEIGIFCSYVRVKIGNQAISIFL